MATLRKCPDPAWVLPMFAIVILLILLQPAWAEKEDAAEDGAAIQKLLDTALKAYNAHDARAWSMVFHPDGELTNVIGWTFHGRQEIEPYFRRLFAPQRHPKLPSFQKAVVKPDGAPQIRFLRPDVASVRYAWTQSGATGLKDEALPPRGMLLTLQVTKEKGVWGIASYHNMDLRPGQPREAPAELKTP